MKRLSIGSIGLALAGATMRVVEEDLSLMDDRPIIREPRRDPVKQVEPLTRQQRRLAERMARSPHNRAVS